MTRPLSNDLRRRLIDAVEAGLSRRAAAERFGVAPSTAIRWVQSWRETGRLDPKPQGGDKRSHRIEAHAEELLALIEETPDVTLSEMSDHLNEAHRIRVATSTVWRFLDRHGLTFKKNRACQRATKS